MIRITTLAGRRVAVFGLGASGIATAKALIAGGADVVASDDGAASLKAAADEGIPTADLKDANWAVFSALILAPGIPLTHPEPHWTVRAAKLAGVEVIGEGRHERMIVPWARFVARVNEKAKAARVEPIALMEGQR